MSFFYFGWEAGCDICGELLEGRDVGSIPKGKGELIRVLRDVGCTVNGERVVCPDCREEPTREETP